MRIALSTDHAGFEAVGVLREYLVGLGHEVNYLGPETFDAKDDYPEFIAQAARSVAGGECEMGVILGGSGQGEAIAANRHKGVRCAVFYSPAVAKTAIDYEGNSSVDPYEILKLSRQHNNANMLSLSGRFLSQDEMKQAITVWLSTPYSGEERHSRRISQLDNL